MARPVIAKPIPVPPLCRSRASATRWNGSKIFPKTSNPFIPGSITSIP